MKKRSVLISLVSVFVLILFVLLALGSGGSDTTVTPSSETPSSSDNGDGGDQEATATGNSRSNPAGLNEAFTVSKDDLLVGKVTYEVEMIELVSGDEAWSVVRNANQFNDAPGDGKEYILAKFRIKIISTEEDEPYDINHAKFSVVSGGGVEYTDFISVAGLNPDLRANLYEGAEHVGWTYFIVDTDDEAPVVALDRRLSSEVWFKLRN
jgi:hypothetical protein